MTTDKEIIDEIIEDCTEDFGFDETNYRYLINRGVTIGIKQGRHQLANELIKIVDSKGRGGFELIEKLKKEVE